MFRKTLTLKLINAIIMNIKRKVHKMANEKAVNTEIEAKRATKHDETATERREVFKSIYGVSILGKFDLKSGKVTSNSILEQFQANYNKVKNKSLEKVQALYKDYSYAIFFMYSSSAIRNNLVNFKNVIKKEGGKYQANAIEAFTIDNIYTPVKLKDTKTKKAIKKQIQKGETDSQNVDPLVVQKQITELKDTLDNKKYKVAKNQKEPQVRAYYILALLGLSSGRRFTELLKTLTIRKRGTRLTFDGLLKGNDKAIEGNLIGLSYTEFKKYLTELRKTIDTKELTENEVNSKYARVFNNAMKRLGFKNVKTLRHNYSVAGSQLFKKDGEDIEDTITRILGHKEVFTSALNYA